MPRPPYPHFFKVRGDRTGRTRHRHTHLGCWPFGRREVLVLQIEYRNIARGTGNPPTFWVDATPQDIFDGITDALTPLDVRS